MNNVSDFHTTFRIAARYPQTIFYLYTKNHIDYQKSLKGMYRPENLKIGFSFKKLNAHLDSFFPDLKNSLESMGYDFFTVVTDIKRASNCLAQTHGATCGKSCNKCMTSNKQIIFFEVH